MFEQLNVSIELNFGGVTQVVDRGGGPVIQWDPTAAMVVRTPHGGLEVQSAAMGLLHEMIHIYFGQQIRNPQDTKAFEQAVTDLESAIGKALGEPVRLLYEDAIKILKVDNPTLHTEVYKWVQMNANGSTVSDTYTGNPYVIPDLAPMPPIDIGGSGGGGGSGIPGGDGGDFYTPDGIPVIDPSLPRNGKVDVIPGAVTPAVGGEQVIWTPDPEAAEVDNPDAAGDSGDANVVLVGITSELLL